jgi:hypothetical protein
MVCVTSSKYVMFADLYAPTDSVDEFTGAIVKTWELVSTIPCLARSIITTSTGSNSSNYVTGKFINYPENTIKFRSRTPIDTSYRVVAIRNDQEVIWKEDQYGANNGGIDGATIFEPRGSTPITDHTGRVLEYETMLERQEIQQLTVA